MRQWLHELDELLRGGKTQADRLAVGTDHLPVGLYAVVCVVLGAIYGAAMGLYSVLSREPAVPIQVPASAIKVPMLFLCTLIVTFPSLYVFSALLRTRLRPVDAMRLLVASITVNLAVLASFAPITVFFTLTTTSYPFMKLLSFAFFVVAGLIGLGFLLKALNRLEVPASPVPDEGEAAEAQYDEAAPAPNRSGRRVFRVWLVIYSLVGAQMGWVLRPFIGTPDLPFTWFRQRGGNVFLDVIRTLGELFNN